MAELNTKSKVIQVRLVQWCNDWFIVDAEDGHTFRSMTCGVLRLTLTSEERDMVRESIANGEAGQMGNWFDLQDDGTFKRKKRSLE